MQVAWRDSSDGDRALMHVFPLCSNSKIPTVGSAGFKNAIPVLEAKKKWPGIMDGNYGIHPGKSDLIVFDIDVKDGRTGSDTFSKLQDKYGKLAETLVVTTPSGGFHTYFKRPASLPHVGNISIGKDIDTRCDGGYVVGAGSSIDGKGYAIFKDHSIADLPDKWVAFIESLVNDKPVSTQSTQSTTIETGSGLISKDVGEALTHIPSDDRDDWLRVGMALKSTDAGNEAFEVWDKWSQSSSKYDADDQIKTWQSLSISGGINIETVFSMAMDRGWINVPTLPIANVVDQPLDVYSQNDNANTATVLTPPFGALLTLIDYYTNTSTRQQPMFAVQTALAIASTVLGRRFKTDLGNYSSLYFLNVGLSCTGKEHAKTVIEEVLDHVGYDEKIGGDGFTSDSAVFGSLISQPVNISCIDEFGLYLKATKSTQSHMGGAINALMQAIGRCHSVFRPKAFSAHGKKQSEIDDMRKQKIYNPALTILASTTPSTLFASMTQNQIKDGFYGRFVTCISDVQRQVRVSAISDGSDELEKLALWVNAIDSRYNNLGDMVEFSIASPDIKPNVITINYTASAKRACFLFEQECVDLMNELDKEDLAEMAGRTAEFAMRMSLICALSDNPNATSVGEKHVVWSNNYMRQCLHSSLDAVRKNMHGSDFEENKMMILKALRKLGKKGISNREWQKTKPFSRFDERGQGMILRALILSGCVSDLSYVNKGAPGRKRMAWVAINQEESN